MGRRLFPLLVVLSCGALRCDATDSGAIAVSLEVRDPGGVALDCETLGAAEIELLLHVREDDVLAYDRMSWPCRLGRSVASADVGTYERVEVRLVGSAGATVRLCGASGTTEARVSLGTIEVEKGATVELPVILEGTPGSCPAPAPVGE